MLQTGKASVKDGTYSNISERGQVQNQIPQQQSFVQPLQPMSQQAPVVASGVTPLVAQVPQVMPVQPGYSQVAPQLAQNANPTPLVANTVNPLNPINNGFTVVNTYADKIIVEHNKDKSEFAFYNFNRQPLGTFTVLQLFKYLNGDIDTYLVGVNVGASEELIRKYIYNSLRDSENTCELISHVESPFTGNVELLIKLYTDILKVEQELNTELLTKSIEVAEKIKDRQSKFIYNLLTRILKLSNILIEKLDSNPAMGSNKEIKDTLLRYSVGSVYKLSQLIKEDVTIKSLQLENVRQDISKLERIQQSMSEKIDKVKESIDTQNKSIDALILQLTLNETKNAKDTKDQVKQQGGEKSSPSSTSSTKSDSEESSSKSSSSKSSEKSKSSEESNNSNQSGGTTSDNSISISRTSDQSASQTVTQSQSKSQSKSQSRSSAKLSVSSSPSYSITNVTSQSAGANKKYSNKSTKSTKSTTIPRVTSHLSDFSVTSVTHNIKPLDNIYTDKTKSYMRSYNINSSINNNTNDSINITATSD